MSHFTVLVPANNEQELKAALQPFHEYECTGIKDQYVVFQEADLNKCKAEYQEYESEYSFEDFLKEWYGYENLTTGRWGRWTNPNKKWDWWTVGGRWRNSLILKNGTKADSAANHNIDWEAIRQLRYSNAASKWHTWRAVQSEPNEEKKRRIAIDSGIYFLSKDESELLESLTLEEYSDRASKEMPFWAFIDLQGQWNEKADMGWWGTSSDPKPESHNKFWAFIESLPPEQQVCVVDCHI